MNTGRNVDVDAHIQMRKLRVHQRVDAYSADARLERTGGHWHPIANLQRSLLSVESANLRVLNQFRVTIREQGLRGSRADVHLEIFGGQISNTVQIDCARSIRI